MSFNLIPITFPERDSLIEQLVKQGWKEDLKSMKTFHEAIWKSFKKEDKSVNFYKDGDVYFFKLLHKEDGINKIFHREDGPAIIKPGGKGKYYIEGKPISEKEFLFQQNIENILK